MSAGGDAVDPGKGPLLSRLRSLGSRGSSRASAGLVKPNLAGSALPPEFGCKEEVTAVTSAHQEASPRVEGCTESPSASKILAISDGAGSQPGPPKLWSRLSGRQARHSKAGHPSASSESVASHEEEASAPESLTATGDVQDVSRHRQVQNLAEHYRDRSRKLAAKRDMHRASNEEERVGVVLDHHLKDIDSI